MKGQCSLRNIRISNNNNIYGQVLFGGLLFGYNDYAHTYLVHNHRPLRNLKETCEEKMKEEKPAVVELWHDGVSSVLFTLILYGTISED